MNRKLLLGIGGAVAIFIVGLLALSLGFGQKKTSSNASQQGPSQLEIVQALPKTKAVLLPIQQIAFQFNQPLKADGFSYTVSPNVETTVTIDSRANLYTITPKTAWKTGKTTIVISKTTTTLDGKTLKNQYSYNFSAAFPKQEQFTEKPH